MKWPFAVLLALGLVGCVESGNFEKEKPMQLAVPTEPNRSPTKPIPREPWTARAKALGWKRTPDQNGACTSRSQSTDTHLRCKVRALNRLREAAYSK